jgi:hypothetical protein
LEAVQIITEIKRKPNEETYFYETAVQELDSIQNTIEDIADEQTSKWKIVDSKTNFDVTSYLVCDPPQLFNQTTYEGTLNQSLLISL